MPRCQSSLLEGFTDDWDAALLSEGTLQPKRAASAMNLREVMKTLNQSPVGVVTKEDLDNQFSRSMKLLGLDKDTSSIKTTSKPKLKNVSPRTITRLDKPTVSYEDIRNAVTDGVDRKVLSQAAYERWYFRKLEEQRDSRRLQGFFDLSKNRSKLFEHGMTFSEWLEKKEKERKLKKAVPEKTANDKSIKRLRPLSSPAAKEAAEKAYEDWMSKKKSEEARKKQKSNENLHAKNTAKSREDAEKAFEQWKQTCDEKLKKMEKRKKNQEKKAKEKEQDEKERHLQDCEKAFNAWLLTKNHTLHEQLEKSKKQSMVKSLEEQRRLAEKRYEAKQAFEEWLEKKLEIEATKTPTPDIVRATKSIQTDVVPKTSATPASKSKMNTFTTTSFPKNLMVPWADFSAKNQLTSPKHKIAVGHRPIDGKIGNNAQTPKKQRVKFADSFDSDSPVSVGCKLSKSYDYKDLTKIRELSDNKTLMMLYHKRDPNCALYYARDLI